MLQAQDGAVAAGQHRGRAGARARAARPALAAIAGWHKMQDTYALLGTVAVAFCNRVGNEEGLTFWGGSRLLAADGSVVAEGPLYEEALVVGALETDDLRMQRYQLPLLADERLELVRRELDRIIAERAGLPEPTAEEATGVSAATATEIERRCPAIDADAGGGGHHRLHRSQLEQTGFERLVVGLSGGVDSATVAFLAARAIGPDNLLAVRMPYRTSSARLGDRCACASSTPSAADTERVEITPMVEPMLALIGDGDESALQVRRGNVMARQRMIVLYDRSAAFDALVCGTGNKTEALLGYGTLHGDMAAAIAAHRRPVQEPAARGGHRAGRAGARSWPSRHPPTCGRARPMRASWAPRTTTWTGSCSRWSTGAGPWSAACAPGWTRELVRWVDARVARNEFKRQMPPVAKVSLRTPGIDHLYPRRRPGSRRDPSAEPACRGRPAAGGRHARSATWVTCRRAPPTPCAAPTWSSPRTRGSPRACSASSARDARPQSFNEHNAARAAAGAAGAAGGRCHAGADDRRGHAGRQRPRRAAGGRRPRGRRTRSWSCPGRRP